MWCTLCACMYCFRDTHSVFPRRKATTGRVTKKPLFRFNSSKHAISINSYMREQRDIQLVGGGGAEGAKALSAHHFDHDQPSIGQHLVCKPHHRNVTGEGVGMGSLG